MYCQKCGKELRDDSKFCLFCGCVIEGLGAKDSDEHQSTYNGIRQAESTTSNPQATTASISQVTTEYKSGFDRSKGSSKNKSKKTVILFATIGFVVLSALIVALIFVFNNNSSKNTKFDPRNNDNSIIQANMTNWGYAVSDGEGYYYSDGKTGIYSFNDADNKTKFIDGSFSDLGVIDGIIFCVENNEGSSHVVAIDTKTKKKDVLYTPPASDIMLISKNVLNGNYYFSAGSTLYSVDRNYDLKNTGIKNAIAVTSSGIYTSETDEYGLLLVSFSNEVVHRYDDLSNVKINSIFFETENLLYYTTIDDQSKTNPIYKLDLDSEKSSALITDVSLLQNNILSYLNHKDDYFYFSTSTTSDGGKIMFHVYRTDKNGNNATLIHSSDGGELPFCTLNIVGDYLFVDFPISNISGKSFKISTLQQIAENSNSISQGTFLEKRIVDDAGLLTVEEQDDINRHLNETISNLKLDIVIVTVETVNNKSVQAFADDYYDDNGYGYGDSNDGLIFLLVMDSRDWYVSTCGRAIDIFSDERFDLLTDDVIPHLSSGDYFGGFNQFIDNCEKITKRVNFNDAD